MAIDPMPVNNSAGPQSSSGDPWAGIAGTDVWGASGFTRANGNAGATGPMTGTTLPGSGTSSAPTSQLQQWLNQNGYAPNPSMFPGGGQVNPQPQRPQQQQQGDPIQQLLLTLLTSLFGGGQQQQQGPDPRIVPGDAMTSLANLGGTAPQFLRSMQQGQPIQRGNYNDVFAKTTGFNGLPSPQSLGNLSQSEGDFFQGLLNSPLVGIPMEDLLGSIFAPFMGLQQARTARTK